MRGWCQQGAGKATKMDEQQAAAFAKLIELTDKIEPGEIIDMIDLLAIEDEAKKPTKGCHAFRACWVSIERAEHITQLAIFTPLPSSASFWVDQLRRRGGGLEQQNTSSSQHFFDFRALHGHHGAAPPYVPAKKASGRS